jgi:hypothetical protein
MLAWHVPYLGWRQLPADVSEFEITHFFSLRPEERSAVLTRYRDSFVEQRNVVTFAKQFCHFGPK